MKKQEIDDLQQINNPIVKKLVAEYLQIKTSPVFGAWQAMHNQIETWSNEMMESPVRIRSTAKVKKSDKKQTEGEVNPEVNDEQDEKAFNKAEKIMDKLHVWVRNAQTLYALMDPNEKDKADSIKNKSKQVAV